MLDVIAGNLGLIFIGLGVVLFLVYSILCRYGFKPSLRQLKGYDALPEQVGQAIESGGRMHISLGPEGIVGERTGVTLASLAVLEIAAKASSISDLSPVATTSDATALPVAGDTVRRAYQQTDAANKFDSKSARLVALDPLSLAAGTTSIIADDDVRANIMVGAFGEELMLIAEAGSRQGVPQVAGSDRLEGQAAAYAAADQALIGEELFVARAYLTEEPSAKASLATQDTLRWVVILLIIAGVVLQTLGFLG